MSKINGSKTYLGLLAYALMNLILVWKPDMADQLSHWMNLALTIGGIGAAHKGAKILAALKK